MISKAIQYTSIEDAEIGQANILAWLKIQKPNTLASRWANPFIQNGNVYILIEDRVIECPECVNFIELEIIQENVV